MTRPASYKGEATIAHGRMASFSQSFNPLQWPKTAPYLWTETFLIPPVIPPAPVPGSAHDLPRRRSDAAAKAADQPSWSSTLLFEGARFGVSVYRNVLQTSFEDGPDKVSFTYDQVQCLTTEAWRPFDGGIDMDFGQGTATRDPVSNAIHVVVEKTVRFTQPAPIVDDVNLLAHVMVPLSFDFWLHSGLFDGA